MRLEIQFATALTTTTSVLVYAEFESLLELDETRNIPVDYSN